MGFQGGAGRSGMLPGSAAGNSTPWAMAHGLAQEAATWTTCPCDAQRDRRFLAPFAFGGIQAFLRAWHCHQELSPLRGVAAGMMGH